MSYPTLPDDPIRLEEEILEKWRAERLFHRTLEATARGAPFVFYEGPPTANGRPGLHHILSRTFKDLVCRYRTMQGRSVTRMAGWDTHGLPVEIEAERKLGISGKTEIEKFGIARFNQVCRESVFTYKEDWERLSERIGYWLDYSRPYITFHPDYIESLWWILKEMAHRGFLYRGYKSVPYCPRCGTALSSHEVALGYEEVEDPSLFFLCPWLEPDGGEDPQGRAFLVWTTTPWTVPSNVGLAIHPHLRYVEAEVKGRRLVLAEALVERVLGEGIEVVRRYEARELAGRRYRRPLDLVPIPPEPGNSWTVVLEEFVSAEEGTGIVHLAPAFGADDYAAGRRHNLAMLKPVDDAGRFTGEVGVVGGMFVKDADPLLVEELRKRGNLFRLEAVVHSYPHCWRCTSPLLYMARDSWFAATSSVKDRMLEENQRIRWIPPEMGERRFGDWLANNVDWALSRDRYWGTPLPVWVCESDPSHVEWIGGFQELAEKAGGLPPEFEPHRPYIDEFTWACAVCGGLMRRSPAVVDVWFDSGAMPYAQWHYPFENQEVFERHFPADFICEAVDQTRGWFYSLLAVSVLMGRGSPYKNVMVNGHILDKEGQKMSKSRGNVVDPWDAVATHGADAVRWYMITASQPWASKRYDAEGVREAARKHFDTWFNTYRFFALYASIEGWRPTEKDPSPPQRSLLDRWVLSRLHGLVAEVGLALELYEVTRACRSVGEFLVEDLSNWYVRRSRPRFWGNAPDARAAFRTLWECLVTLCRLLAPATPFSADWIHRALVGESVHLASFPTPDEPLRDRRLEEAMEAVRALVSLGRAAREEVRIRVRQPLRRLFAVLPPGKGELEEELWKLVREELNIKEISVLGSGDTLLRLVPRPNYRALGPRFGKRTEAVAEALRALPQEALAAFRRGQVITVVVAGEKVGVREEELEVAEEAEGGLVVKGEGGYLVALDPTLDEELRREGLARELVNRIQRLRRDAGLEVTDRIVVGIQGPEQLLEAARVHGTFIAGETLARKMVLGEEAASIAFHSRREMDLDGLPVRVFLSRA